MKTVSESIFDGKRVVIPMADVQHIEKKYWDCDLVSGIKKGDLMGAQIITKHTRYDMDADTWSNPIWLDASELPGFMQAWCTYRHELEIDTLADPYPEAAQDWATPLSKVMDVVRKPVSPQSPERK